MQEKELERGRELEISLQQIVTALLRKAWLIVLVAVICGLLAAIFTIYFITPLYQSSAIFYVNNGSNPGANQGTGGISSSDITASKNLVDSYIIILNTRETLTQVAEQAKVDLSYEDILAMVSASSVNSTELFRVVVTSDDPAEAEAIAGAIAVVLPPRIGGIIEGSSAEVVDQPVLAAEPSSPNLLVNTILAFMMGAAVVVIVVFLRELFDVTIRSEEDVTSSCSYPILAEVPDMSTPSKGGYYSKSSKKSPGSGEVAPAHVKKNARFGENLNFASSEAYKLLRTKLQFSFADERNSRVIGVASALAGEGKSLTSSNLTYTLAQLEKRVLLVECDMRRPSISTVMPVRRTPGLSNYLTSQAHRDELIQSCIMDDGKVTYDVIAAGRTPPNPIELLSSPRMEKLINSLRESYDYIILDLPPVGEVSDAMVVTGLVDGMLLVVRQNYCNRIALSDAVRQFEFVNTRILGTVFNCTVENSNVYGRKKYYRYGKYGKYGKYGSYASSYASAMKKAKKRAAKSK